MANANESKDSLPGQLDSVQKGDKSLPPESQKPKKPEDKPFREFIDEEFLPSLLSSLTDKGHPPKTLKLIETERPVVGGICSSIFLEFPSGRRLWLSFSQNKINSTKTIALAEPGSDPSLLESFLIDERKTTKALLLSRTLQRLNGQKWLGEN